MKICPKCHSNKVIIFDSDNDYCEKCKNWFPAVVEIKCEAGCKAFTGGEIKHHPDCYFYAESFSKRYDDLEAKHFELASGIHKIMLEINQEILDNRTGLNIGKRGCLKRLEELMTEQKISDKTSEKESPKTIEWYEAQSQELLDIRKAFYRLLGDTANGNDAYFPDLVEKELRRLLNGKANM